MKKVLELYQYYNYNYDKYIYIYLLFYFFTFLPYNIGTVCSALVFAGNVPVAMLTVGSKTTVVATH
jgi:hypothetical protein